MAIQSQADFDNALKITLPWNKVGQSPTAGRDPSRAFHCYYEAGIPVTATGSAAGVNGEAVVPTGTGVSAIPRRNPPGGTTAYLARFSVNLSQVPGSFMLVDRLWQNSGLSPTLTTAQSIASPAAMAARDLDGSTNGRGVFAALEWVTQAGSGTSTATITYTNSAGTAGRTGTVSSLSSVAKGGFEFFSLQAGDQGVRSIQSFQWSATHTSGTFSLVLFRPIALLDAPHFPAALDEITGCMPIIQNGTVYNILHFPTPTGVALNSAGQIVEAWG